MHIFCQPIDLRYMSTWLKEASRCTCWGWGTLCVDLCSYKYVILTPFINTVLILSHVRLRGIFTVAPDVVRTDGCVVRQHCPFHFNCMMKGLTTFFRGCFVQFNCDNRHIFRECKIVLLSSFLIFDLFEIMPRGERQITFYLQSTHRLLFCV